MAKAFEKWEIAVAKNLVNQFINTNRIRGYDFDDLLQECLIHWYEKRGKYRSDKEATKKTFMGHILRRRLQEILRRELADKRKVNQLVEPLVVTFSKGDSDEEKYDFTDRKQEEKNLSFQHYFGLKKDVEDLLTILEPSQRKMCNLIMKGYPMAEISRILNKPRATLYDEIERIRRIFSDEGLKEYLE